MTPDDNVIKAVDRFTKELCATRSAFMRKAPRTALIRYRLEQQEKKIAKDMNKIRFLRVSLLCGKPS